MTTFLGPVAIETWQMAVVGGLVALIAILAVMRKKQKNQSSAGKK